MNHRELAHYILILKKLMCVSWIIFQPSGTATQKDRNFQPSEPEVPPKLYDLGMHFLLGKTIFPFRIRNPRIVKREVGKAGQQSAMAEKKQPAEPGEDGRKTAKSELEIEEEEASRNLTELAEPAPKKPVQLDVLDETK